MCFRLSDLPEFNIDQDLPVFCNLQIPLIDCCLLLLQHKPQVKNVNHISQNVRRAPSPLRPRPPSAVAAEKLAAKKQEEEKRYQRGKVPK